MTNEPKPFIEYWEAVDAAMLKFFAIDTSDAGIDADLIASAQEECQTPEDFARWYGNKHSLTYLDDSKALYGAVLAVAEYALDYLDGQEYLQACAIIARARKEK
jgi:hypothetical protein